MEALIKFDKQELIKSIHANNEMISLTDLWKQSGEDAQRTPAKWQESEPVQRFIQTASKILNIGISDIIKSKRGKGGGTYAHKQIALEMSDRHLRRKMAEGKINYLKRPGTCGRVYFTDEQINKYIQTQMQP